MNAASDRIVTASITAAVTLAIVSVAGVVTKTPVLEQRVQRIEVEVHEIHKLLTPQHERSSSNGEEDQ